MAGDNKPENFQDVNCSNKTDLKCYVSLADFYGFTKPYFTGQEPALDSCSTSFNFIAYNWNM